MARPGIRRRLLPAGASVAAVVIADQASKAWAVRRLPGDPVHVVGPVRLAVSYNTGGAFGIGQGFAPVLLLAAVGLVAVLVVARRRVVGGLSGLGVSLVLGGALGNLADRIFRDAGAGRGSVVDFIDIGFWPVFNVADVAITCGCALLLLTVGRE